MTSWLHLFLRLELRTTTFFFYEPLGLPDLEDYQAFLLTDYVHGSPWFRGTNP